MKLSGVKFSRKASLQRRQVFKEGKSSKKERVLALVARMNQAVDDRENERGGNAEQEHSIHRFKRSEQPPLRRQHDVGARSRITASGRINGRADVGDRARHIED